MSSAALRVRQRRGAAALAGRETRRVLSLWTQTILPPILTALLFLAVFGAALGGRIHDIEGLTYLTFILPGLLVMTVAGQSFANCSTSLFQAKSEGYIEDVLTSPLRGWQLALAYLAGGLTRGLLAALTVALLALPFADEGAEPTLAAIALLLTGLAFSALGVITGIWADTFDQHAFVANIVITPLTLRRRLLLRPHARRTVGNADARRPALLPRRRHPQRPDRLPRVADVARARGHCGRRRRRRRHCIHADRAWLAAQAMRFSRDRREGL